MDGLIHCIHEMICNTNQYDVNEQRNITKGQGDEQRHCCDTFFVRPCYFALWLKCHQTTWCVVCPPFLFALTKVAITRHLPLRCTQSHMSWQQLQARVYMLILHYVLGGKQHMAICIHFIASFTLQSIYSFETIRNAVSCILKS